MAEGERAARVQSQLWPRCGLSKGEITVYVHVHTSDCVYGDEGSNASDTHSLCLCSQTHKQSLRKSHEKVEHEIHSYSSEIDRLKELSRKVIEGSTASTQHYVS